MKFSNLTKLVVGGVLSLASYTAVAQNITGAGASFPVPVYAKWAEQYKKETGVQVNYQSMGSSAGVNQIKAKTVDFGASDKPLTDKELQEAGLIQFPTVIGGVVPIVNIQGVKPGQLVLSGNVLAEIFLGNIKKWNDKQITDLNPGVNLPDKTINLVTRADGSGTTFVFTSYLSKVSKAWADKVGADNAVKWPAGSAGKGNEGVSAFVGRLANSIGYVEYAYSKQNNLAYVDMLNSAGKRIEPNQANFKAAAEGIDWTKSFDQDMTNINNPSAWPISTATFIIMQAKQANPNQGAATLRFFDWAYKKGDQSALELDYAVFPESVKNAVRNEWKKITDSNGKSVAY